MTLTSLGVGMLLVTPSVIWIALDRSVWPWDPAWYAEVSLDLWATLSDAPRAWPDAMTAAFGSKPPGIAWLGQFFLPLAPIVGAERALLVSIVACQVVSLALLFSAVRRLSGEVGAALVAALVLGASPLFVWATHEYFPEALQTLVVAWALFILVIAGRTSNPVVVAAQLPGLAGVAMLAKLSSPLYIALPMVAACFPLAAHIRRDWPLRREWVRSPVTIATAVGSIVVVVGAIRWYVPNLDAAVEHARSSSADTGLYGTQRNLATEVIEWSHRLTDVVFLPAVAGAVAVIALLGAASFIVPRRVLPKHPLADRRVLVAIICLVQVVLVVLAFSMQPNEEARFLLPSVPFIATLVALSVSRSRVLVAATITLLCVELAFVTLQGLGVMRLEGMSYHRLTAPHEDPALRSTLERLVALTCTDQSAERTNVVGAEYAWFNANTFAMLSSKRASRVVPKCRYTSLGYAESDAERAWRRLTDMEPPFYISIDYGNPRNRLPRSLRIQASRVDSFNRVDRKIFRRMKTAHDFEVVPGTRRHGFVVFASVDGMR